MDVGQVVFLRWSHSSCQPASPNPFLCLVMHCAHKMCTPSSMLPPRLVPWRAWRRPLSSTRRTEATALSSSLSFPYSLAVSNFVSAILAFWLLCPLETPFLLLVSCTCSLFPHICSSHLYSLLLLLFATASYSTFSPLSIIAAQLTTMTVTGTGLLDTFDFKAVPVATNGCGKSDSSDAADANLGQSADPMGYFLTVNMTLPSGGSYRMCFRPGPLSNWVPLSDVLQCAGIYVFSTCNVTFAHSHCRFDCGVLPNYCSCCAYRPH